MGELRARAEIFESPGKKYPRLCLLFLALVLFGIISWLPHLNDKERGPLAFVWPENQTRSTRHLVRPDQVTTLLKPLDLCSPRNSTSGSDPYLLIVVCSAVANWEARIAVRGTDCDPRHTWPVSGERELGEGPVDAFWGSSRLSRRAPCQQLQTGDLVS